MTRNRLFRGATNQKGQALIELALCGVIYALLMLGTLDVARLMFRLHQITQVAREGARIASMTREVDTEAGESLVQAKIDQILSKLTLSGSPGLEVKIETVTVMNGGEATELVEVTLSQKVSDVIHGASIVPGLEEKKIQVKVAMPQFS